MIRFDIISAVPALLSGPLDHSIVKRAKEKNSWTFIFMICGGIQKINI